VSSFRLRWRLTPILCEDRDGEAECGELFFDLEECCVVGTPTSGLHATSIGRRDLFSGFSEPDAEFVGVDIDGRIEVS